MHSLINRNSFLTEDQHLIDCLIHKMFISEDTQSLSRQERLVMKYITSITNKANPRR